MSGERIATSAKPIVADGEVFCPEQLLHRCLGKLELAQRVLDRFLDNVDQDVEQLRGAVRDNDAGQLARTAHRVKGSSASIAAPRLQRLMADLEAAGRQQEPTEIEVTLELVQTELECLKEVLSQWREGESRTSIPAGGRSVPLSTSIIPGQVL